MAEEYEYYQGRYTGAQVDEILGSVDGKIDEPSSDGTDGQVLATDGSGGRYWKTVSGGGGGGTDDFEALSNRPKYNGTVMDGSTDIPFVPTSIADLSTDSTHRLVTDAEKSAWNAKANSTDIPTKTSDLTNDSGFLTEHQSLSAYRTASAQDAIDDGKIDEPSSDGTDGQVLATDGSGGRYWKTVSGGGGGGTDDFEALSNRPKYNGTTMSHTTNIPEVKTAAWDAKQDSISDLATIRSGAALGATAVQPETGKGLFSGSYNDLTNKPTIPSAVTEATVSGWGFTKNTGTYSKPSGGIPKTDLATTVQTSLGKADTALQASDITGKADKGNSFTVTLTVAGWSNKAQTVSNSNFQASGYSYIVTPAYSSLSAWKEADISVEDISSNGSCVFHCENVPASAIAVNVTRVVVGS